MSKTFAYCITGMAAGAGIGSFAGLGGMVVSAFCGLLIGIILSRPTTRP